MNGLALPVIQLIEIEPRRGTAETSDFECLRHCVRFVPVLFDQRMAEAQQMVEYRGGKKTLFA